MTTNEWRQEALDFYNGIAAEQVENLRATGVVFAPEDMVRAERAALMEQLKAVGGRVRNGGASVILGPISKACVACTGNCVSQTQIITNNCHRDCYFCFNPNQEDFAYYCEHDYPWKKALEEMAADAKKPGGEAPTCLALTGGEPMLKPKESYAFLRMARELFPGAHLRIYTAGDLLTEDSIRQLAEAGLDEIRFSVKQEDTDAQREKVYANMVIAKRYIPTLMVEMPIVPNSEEQMHEMLRRFQEIGVDAVNLLEFTYAMWNWEAFEDRGYTLKNPPYEVAYDYTYAGALAVEGSEELCLKLMLWAHEQGLTLGLHYCSLENKHRGQIRQTNEKFKGAHPCYAFDYDDYFMKTAMVYGPDRAPVAAALRLAGCKQMLDDAETASLSFPPKYLPVAAKVRGAGGRAVEPCVSYNVMVEKGGAVSFRELALKPYGQCPEVQLEPVTDREDATWTVLG